MECVVVRWKRVLVMGGLHRWKRVRVMEDIGKGKEYKMVVEESSVWLKSEGG
jgi:hypothetical protein